MIIFFHSHFKKKEIHANITYIIYIKRDDFGSKNWKITSVRTIQYVDVSDYVCLSVVWALCTPAEVYEFWYSGWYFTLVYIIMYLTTRTDCVQTKEVCITQCVIIYGRCDCKERSDSELITQNSHVTKLTKAWMSVWL